DFGFSDPNDSPANALAAVKITTLATNGVQIGRASCRERVQLVSATDIADGKLKFVADANESGKTYGNFTFQVQDDGGTANGGVDLDPSANTFTINVTSVNDAPAGTDNGKTINEDSSYTLAPADFGFSDPNDSPANALAAVKITTLATNGV